VAILVDILASSNESILYMLVLLISLYPDAADDMGHVKISGHIVHWIVYCCLSVYHVLFYLVLWHGHKD